MTKRKHPRHAGQDLPQSSIPTHPAPPEPAPLDPALPPEPPPPEPPPPEPAPPEPAQPEPAPLEPPLTRTQRELCERLSARTMACHTAYGLLMPFMWESAGIHPAELEALAIEALSHAARAFDTTWGLDFDSFAQPHVYVHLIAVARRRRRAHRISRALFGYAPKWLPWADTQVKPYHHRSDLLDAIHAAYSALSTSQRRALDHHYDCHCQPGWLISEAERCGIEPEELGSQALDQILRSLIARGVVTCKGAAA